MPTTPSTPPVSRKPETPGWPDLTGTAEQVPWSFTVRDQKIREVDESDMPDADKDKYREVLLRETHAAVWLDTRRAPWQVMWWGNLTTDERTALLNSRSSE